MSSFLQRIGDPSVRGSLLVSAGSTLPIHLMPMIVDGMLKEQSVALGAEAVSMSASLAGGVLGAFLMGFCCLAASLALLGIKYISKTWGWAALAILPLWVLMAVSVQGKWLLVPWFGIGLSCGGLQYMANLMVAQASDKQVAFASRLAVTLVGNGCIALLLQLAGGFASPFDATKGTAIGIIVLVSLGLPWYALSHHLSQGHARLVRGLKSWVGLVSLFFMFAGIHGFTAFAFSNGQELGLESQAMVWCLIMVKILAGVWALYVIARPLSFEGSLWVSGGITLSGLLLLQFGDNLPLFFAGMLLREFGLNALSARFLANVTNTNPMAVAPWLALFMFGGSAFGPVLRGISIDYQTPLIFSMFSFGVCLLPAVYVWWLRSRTAPM